MRAILTYHSIDSSGSPISVSADDFRRHVDWLASGAVAVVPLARILDVPDGADAVAITFDDAFQSFVQSAWPLLRAHGLPVTVFVPTDHVAGENRWDPADGPIPRFPIASWDALERVAAEGVTLGAHTRSHPDLTRLADDVVDEELAGSVERLRALTGTPCRTFAYPFGRFDDRVLACAARHFDLACGVDLRPLRGRENAFRLPRLDAYYFRGNDWMTRWGSEAFRLRLSLRRRARRLRAFAASGRVRA